MVCVFGLGGMQLVGMYVQRIQRRAELHAHIDTTCIRWLCLVAGVLRKLAMVCNAATYVRCLHPSIFVALEFVCPSSPQCLSHEADILQLVRLAVP